MAADGIFQVLDDAHRELEALQRGVRTLTAEAGDEGLHRPGQRRRDGERGRPAQVGRRRDGRRSRTTDTVFGEETGVVLPEDDRVMVVEGFCEEVGAG
ncbi:hypothetical protein ABT269_29910 [Streptomyces viridosporus]|uniref:hypothetical protein n=1 Tax=Streptomyces viridosporus TaxID=67581 RepID=UPI0033195DD3